MGPVKDDCQICLQHGGGGSGVGDIIGNFTNMVSYQWKPNGGHQAWTLIKNKTGDILKESHHHCLQFSSTMPGFN